VPDGKHVKASELRDFSMSNCPALDFFLAKGAEAVSCSNDSFVFSSSFEELAKRLDAVQMWTRSKGFLAVPFPWVFETVAFMDYPPSNLSNAYINEFSWQTLVNRAEEE
jgi:hypothetical protein